MPPDVGLAADAMSGKKGDKTRLTFALTANADGSDLRDLLIIGKAHRPRCYGGKEASSFGFQEYYHNKKAWMNSSIFQQWLSEFDADMRRSNRQVLLLVDNAPSHNFDKESLTNIRVEFFSPNLTSRVQPMDAGIIRTFKAYYKNLFFRKALENDQAGATDPYNITQLQAMVFARRAWESVEEKSEIVKNCFFHTKIFSKRDEEGVMVEILTPE